jgi:hypothetical protein
MSHSHAAGNVTVEALNTEIAGEVAQLTSLRDAAVMAAGRAGGGASTQLNNFLLRGDLPLHGDVTVSLPDGFSADHYTAAGLAHVMQDLQAAHARKIERLRASAVDAIRQYGISATDVNAAFEAAGLEPLKETTRVELSGTVRFNYDGDAVSQDAVQDAITEALNGLGDVRDIDVTGARLSSRKVTA